jgi:hypothetical protein
LFGWHRAKKIRINSIVKNPKVKGFESLPDQTSYGSELLPQSGTGPVLAVISLLGSIYNVEFSKR